jgi:hypothetical protein
MIVAFLGPSLSLGRAEAIADAAFLEPAAQGDVFRAARHRPDVIALIDGRFLDTPAVWHKEILWAMANGVRVVGGGSMGALRAAELADFGMVGVGRVFDAYRCGELSDDDEVALVHADASGGWRPASEPMVNIRATLRAASASGLLADAEREALESLAKATFFPERTYDGLLEAARVRGAVGPAVLEAVAKFLPEGRVDLKGEDAEAVLREAVRLERLPAPRAEFEFEHTALFEQLIRAAGRGGAELADQEQLDADVLEQWLDRQPEAGASLRREAMLRLLARDEAARHGFPASPDLVAEEITRLRLRHGLLEPADLEQWLHENDLDLDAFLALAEEEARLEWVAELLRSELPGPLCDSLRSAGAYPQAKRECNADALQ